MQKKMLPCHGPQALAPSCCRLITRHIPFPLPPIRPPGRIHTYTAGGGDGDGISLSGGGVPGKEPTATGRQAAYKSLPKRLPVASSIAR